MQRARRPSGGRSRSNWGAVTSISCQPSTPGCASAGCPRHPAPRSWRMCSTSDRAVPGTDGTMTVTSKAGDVLLAHIAEQVQEVRAKDLPVRMDATDAVHKMRVATRRLRSALTTFKPLFDPDVARPLRDELKWLAGELGAARDAEVMRDRVLSAVDGKAQTDGGHAGVGVADSELG